MSNLLYMDESNCNGVYASKVNNPVISITTTNNINTTTTTATSNTNNTINNINIMNAAAVNASACAGANTNSNSNTNANANANTSNSMLPTSVSNEDLSQSLSEYTDADESISAPTEFLAEFLSAVMLKDYKKALKYCKLILQYEPNNATAKEFYPLILDKLRAAASSDSDENYNKSSSPELALELHSSDPSAGESDGAVSDDQQHVGMLDDGLADEYGMHEDNCNSCAEPNSRDESSVSAGASLSESVDDDDDDEDVDDDVDDDDDDDIEECDEEEDAISSSGDDLPIDDPNSSLGAAAGVGNDSQSSRNSSSDGGGGGRSRSDNTTHSYSSLLLEEEDDIVPANLKLCKELSSPDLDVSNGNKLPSTSCSDSESPTEPLTQRLAAILLSKCGVSSVGESH